jgi:ribose/xylose/arabinose/galactoside ABC-type transport system permease subunit
VGSTIAFAGVLCATLLNVFDNSLVAILGAVLGGAVIGAFNGAVIAYLRINALITTLATMLIVRGLGFIVSNGQAVGVANENFIALRLPLLNIPAGVDHRAVLRGVRCVTESNRVRTQHARGRRQLEASRLAGIKSNARVC